MTKIKSDLFVFINICLFLQVLLKRTAVEQSAQDVNHNNHLTMFTYPLCSDWSCGLDAWDYSISQWIRQEKCEQKQISIFSHFFSAMLWSQWRHSPYEETFISSDFRFSLTSPLILRMINKCSRIGIAVTQCNIFHPEMTQWQRESDKMETTENWR